ncbi:uncharacterized protein [Nicotiana sylvestris]|uniref:uncharacterized protein n=1 Tax=Nicotiana sylvestris TaxID=4096 RepID=UPI00388C4E3D
MKEGESVEEMFARFSKIIRDLKAFGKPYSSDDQVRKILRSLPTTWQTKVVTLESRDLNKLSCDELRGELIAFEKTHLKKTSPKKKKKKTVAFKATTERVDNDIDVDPEALQEEIAMVSRNMDGLMRRYRNTRRGMILSRRTRQYNEQDKNDGKCYECGRFGHVQAECPDLKRKVFRGFKKNKSFGSRSDEDSSEHEEIANLCFMTILENDMNKLSGCWTDEDTSDDECKDDNENCFMARGETNKVRSYNCEICNELQDILDLTLKEYQKMMNELKRLNKEVKDWKLNLEVCEIEKEVLQEEFEELQMQLNGMRKSTSHSSVKSNQVTYKSTGEGPARIESTRTPQKELQRKMLCDSGYGVKFKKTGCVIEDETCKIILPGKRYGNVYILDSFENIDGHLCLTFISDDPWLWNKKLGHEKESLHVIFDENNTSAKKGIIAGDEDQIQEIQETSKSQESANKPDGVMESTNEVMNSQSESPKESTTHTSTIRPNERRSEPEYPQNLIIGDPNEGIKTRGALKKKANIALISQIEPKKIKEAQKDSSWLQEVYVKQPPGFEDSKFPYHVYKLTKALYGLKLAPRACANPLLCKEFSNLMQSEFEMSMMEELTFFLGLRIQQFEEGTLVCQTKYTKELIQKFGMSNIKAIGTPVSPSTSLDKDEQRKPVDETKYHGMIGSILYLAASRPYIMFSVYKCAKFQSAPKESHLTAVKKIIRYFIGTVSHGLWYPRSNNFKLEGFSDADLAGDKEDRKSTSEICQFLRKALISWNSKNQGSVALSTIEEGFPMLFKNSWPDDFEITFDQAKRCISECSSESLPNQLGPSDVSFETRVLAHIVATSLLPRTGSSSTFSQRDTFLIYYLMTKLKIKLSSWVINFMIESVDDPTSLSYGMSITHILEAYNISISEYPFVSVSKSYNSRAFASMGYVCVKGTWVKKQEGEVKHVQPNPKTKASVSHHSLSNRDLAEKLTTIDNQLNIIKDLLVATQSTVGDIHAISKETRYDVSKIRVAILRFRENTIKAFKEVDDMLDGVTVLANASFEQLKEAICNTLTYFLRR